MTADTLQLVARGGDNTTRDSNIVNNPPVEAEPEHVKARASLKQEILAPIKPHKRSRKRPPFSTPEMIVMAIICGHDATYSPVDIARTSLETYHYYACRILEGILESTSKYGHIANRPGFGGSLWDGIPVFLESVHCLDVQITKQHSDYGPELFTVTPPAARILLELRLCSRRKGDFPFFKLSAELRNNVYDMGLRFHTSGVMIKNIGAQLLQHPEDDDSYQDGDSDITFPTHERSVAAVTMMCKQACAEATPILYGENKFLFGTGGLFYLKANGYTASI